ncbi:hypothetical protein OZX69_03530 [Lactobacillus sp. ESL0731]|uniref:hypothetical protein n=1 Tax=unclassified Lactobacillus TaxID=2620435 RepID=UPI0023F84961|nr:MULTISPECIES: hypothetical protein [unclassified Lactobacillus]WEV51781.1 hypothetical protein OZX63_03530 [Lactobacillus sp. ESL0700]WEV62910.1 hypothetical protein OZX69_03530 [Lactobacillus sp. ESL0731]
MLLRKQVQRLFFRWQTWLAILIGLIIIVIQALTINKVNANAANNAFLHLTGFDFSGAGTTIYYLILPLMCGLAASSTLQEDKKDHRLNELLTRVTKRKYLCTTLISSFIVGGLVGVLPLLIESCYFFLNYHVTNVPKGRDFQIIDPNGCGYSLFIRNTLAFWLCTIVIAFVFSGLFSMIGIVTSYYNIHNGIELIMPFVLAFATIVVADLTGEVEASLYWVLTPTFSNTYSNGIYFILGYFVLITGLIALLTWKESTKDVCN